MNEVQKDRGLTTADLAAARGATAEGVAAIPRPAGRRDYVEEPGERGSPGKGAEVESTPLFSSEEAQRFRSDWDSIQIEFVDEPRESVEKADGLVAQVIKRLAEVFAEERSKLEGQWARGDDVSTEDLRLALQRYRSFFGRLLSL
jgi:hypothetical protein